MGRVALGLGDKRLMESSNPDVQRQRQRDLMAKAQHPAAAKAFVMERAMMHCAWQ